MYIKQHRRFAFLAISILVVAGLQWVFVSLKVSEVDRNLYTQRAFDLRVTPSWRYGFVLTHHGATLVRTPNVNESLPVLESTSDTPIAMAMKRELDLVVVKAGLEMALYVSILVFIFFGAKWLSAKLMGWRGNRYLRLLLASSPWVITWTLAILPLLVWGYGQPLYSSWMGPGAMGWSSPALGSSGLTVTYRVFIEVFAMLPAIVADLVGQVIEYPSGVSDEVLLWLGGLLYYGVLGLLSAVTTYWRSVDEPISS